jgi:hypothetical protein
MEEFIPLRRNNSAVLLCFALVEYILGIDLPESMYQNTTFLKAYWAACDHVCWSNVSIQVYQLMRFRLTIYLRMSTRTTWNSQRDNLATTLLPSS